MKKVLTVVVALLATMTTVLAQGKNFIDQPYVEVNGSADSLVVPNQIFIKIIISEKDGKDKSSVEAQEIKLVAALKALGIHTDTKLSTSDMMSNYKNYFLKAKDVVKTKEYVLEVADAPMAGKVFAALEELGIANAAIERVNHTELAKIQNDCRIKAVVQAKERATALAKPLGQSIGKAVHISEQEMFINDQLMTRAAGMEIVAYGIKQKYEPSTVQFQKIKVSANVQVKFILQ